MTVTERIVKYRKSVKDNKDDKKPYPEMGTNRGLGYLIADFEDYSDALHLFKERIENLHMMIVDRVRSDDKDDLTSKGLKKENKFFVELQRGFYEGIVELWFLMAQCDEDYARVKLYNVGQKIKASKKANKLQA